MPDLAIETINLHKHYGKLQAVRGLNLQVPVGRIYGFLGPNGAGKSTTIRMLLGLVRPTGGEVRLFGHAVGVNGPPQRARAGALGGVRPRPPARRWDGCLAVLPPPSVATGD